MDVKFGTFNKFGIVDTTEGAMSAVSEESIVTLQ